MVWPKHKSNSPNYSRNPVKCLKEYPIHLIKLDSHRNTSFLKYCLLSFYIDKFCLSQFELTFVIGTSTTPSTLLLSTRKMSPSYTMFTVLISRQILSHLLSREEVNTVWDELRQTLLWDRPYVIWSHSDTLSVVCY